MNNIQIKALSDELKKQRRLKYNEYHKKYYHKRVKKAPFISVLDMTNPPPKKVYNRKSQVEDETVSEMDDSFDADADDDCFENESVVSDITDCSLIQTPYNKPRHLKQLDTRLKETLFEKGFNSQERISEVFSTLRNVNPKYGLPVLEQRNERRLTEFYNSTIENLQ